MDYGEKLKIARKERGMSQQELADLLDTTKSTISRWERSLNEPGIETMKIVSEILGKPIQYFLSDEVADDIGILNSNSAFIPVVGEIACGTPILATQNIEEYREVPKRYLPQGEMFILKAKGDSMAPTIVDGDEIMIRRQPDVNDNEIGVVLLDGDNTATLKRVKHVGDSVMLIGDNRNFEPIIMNEDNPGRIIGKAVQLFRDF